MATVLDRVRALIERLAPEPVCDDCIAARLSLGAQDPVSQLTHELAGSHGFERSKADCSLCGASKLVIRKHAR